jgi:hypothetical protein
VASDEQGLNGTGGTGIGADSDRLARERRDHPGHACHPDRMVWAWYPGHVIAQPLLDACRIAGNVPDHEQLEHDRPSGPWPPTK